MIYAYNLDTGVKYGFVATTPYEAMMKLKYTLDLKMRDPAANINKTESGRCLYMVHNGESWAVINK